MEKLMGGGKAAAEARKSARLQEVASNRQLAALQEQDKRDLTTRRNPRGRRLFSDAAPGERQTTLA